MQKRITKDLLIYLPARALPALAGFITIPIYTRLFSPNEFGHYLLAIAASELLMLATVTGFGQAAVRFFSAYQLRSGLSSYFTSVFSSVGLITFLTSVVSAGILVTCRSLISTDLYPLLWAGLFLFIVSACFNTLSDILRGQEKSRWYSVIWIGQHYIGVVLGLILVLAFRMGIGGLIWGQALALFLMIIPLVWLTTRSVSIHPDHLHRSDLKQLWAFAAPYTIGNIAFWVLTSADRYIIEMFRGSYEVGLYGVASKMSSRSIQLLVGLFILVPAPMICRLWEEQGRQITEEALTKFTRMFLLMIVPAVVGLAVVAAPIVRLLADEAYYNGFTAIWLVAVASMGMGLTDLGTSGCMVTNRTRLIARNQCIAAILNLILNFMLIPKFGFMGAAVSAAVSFMALAGLQAISSGRFLTWRWPLTSLYRVLTASAAMAASVFFLQRVLKSDTFSWQAASLLLSIGAGALIYGLVLWILGEVSPKELFKSFRADRPQVETNPVAGEIGQR